MAHGNMNSISTPDLNNLSDSQTKGLNSNARNQRMNNYDFSSKPKVDFEDATHCREIAFTSNDPTVNVPIDGAQLNEEFTRTKRGRITAQNRLDQGVKIKGTYVARRRVITAAVVGVVLLLGIVFFAPPIFKANDSENGCKYVDIFAKKGITQYKSEILNDYNVYNIGAMSSDLSKSYRICTVSFDVVNYTPFTIDMGDYVVANGGEYKDNIVYSASADKDNVVKGFSSRTIKVNILVNKEGLTDEQFDKAVTSLVLSTKGMKKKLFGKAGIPSIPGLMFVSDVVSFDAR